MNAVCAVSKKGQSISGQSGHHKKGGTVRVV